MKTTIEQIPERMMRFLIDGDTRFYSEEDITEAKEWMEESSIKDVMFPTREDYVSYYSHRPAFGESCYVVNCVCLIEW